MRDNTRVKKTADYFSTGIDTLSTFSVILIHINLTDWRVSKAGFPAVRQKSKSTLDAL